MTKRKVVAGNWIRSFILLEEYEVFNIHSIRYKYNQADCWAVLPMVYSLCRHRDNVSLLLFALHIKLPGDTYTDGVRLAGSFK